MESLAAGSTARVRVGSFELDFQSGELRPVGSDGPAETVLLREQPLRVLRMLVERAGRLVTRDEIQKKLWPNDTIVDFDHSINVAIGVLRRALGDSAAGARYIETLSRRGYRLIAPVEWLQTARPGGEIAGLAPRAPLGDLTGRKVSHYRVLEVLGGGGMGLVYKAEDLKLGRRAALKFLPHELAGDAVAFQRLEREAQTASALNHPNICTIYEIEEHAGQPFIGMELLEGETLQQRLAASAPDPLPPPASIDVAIQVCLGLEAAHGKNIVHRDIKPANIFLTSQGTVKLLDFGVAKLVATAEATEVEPLESAPGSRWSEAPPSLTRTGVRVGTAGYMSPEQLRREELDGRSDLFSLGLVLYEMATGRRAFTGETAEAVQETILAMTPPVPNEVNTTVPRPLAAIIVRALEEDRTARYQTAADMRQDLERARTELQQAGTRRNRWLPVAVAVPALAIAAVGAWISWRPESGLKLAPNDTIVLAYLDNTTGDGALDQALYLALRLGLEQTPYVNVLAEDKVSATLGALGIDASSLVTPDVALQVCRRTGSRMMVTSAIADVGNRLAIELKGIDCRSGSAVTRAETEAPRREDVVRALGAAAVQLRRALGEPAESLAQYDAPLDKATSASPEALELLFLGYRRALARDARGAISNWQRATQVDPSCALAHSALAAFYTNMGEEALAAASARAAFALRDRLTVPARFLVESSYHLGGTGDLESARAILSRWVEAFPHDLIARVNFGSCLMDLGEKDRALGQFREAARLRPTPHSYEQWIIASLRAERPDEAEKTMAEALGRGFDTPSLHDLQARLAFLRNDEAAMQRQWTWATGRADASVVVLGKANVEAYRGRVRAARRSAETGDTLGGRTGPSSFGTAVAALWEAEVGLSPSRPVAIARNQPLTMRMLGAIVLARVGQVEEARRAADALRQDFPSHTIVQKYGLPVIHGATALASNDPRAAVTALEPARQYDFAVPRSFDFYAEYVRGLAYLRTGEASLAAPEFQKLLDHPARVGRSVMVPLSRLQLARAQRAMGNEPAALASYEAFLALWKDADPDLPVYRAAKAEHAALRGRLGASATPR